VRERLRFQSLHDSLKHAVDIPDNFVIPKTQDSKTMRSQPFAARGVALVFGMLSAIDFNYQPLFATKEIYGE
jgi:hypothetical protein